MVLKTDFASRLRFSGYRLTSDSQARLFLPGHADDRVEAEALLPYKSKPKPVVLKQEGDYWVSADPLPLGTAYRFKINGEEQFDLLEKVTRNGQDFNLISPHEATAPQKSAVIADIYLDSLVPLQKLAVLAGLSPAQAEKMPPEALAGWIRQQGGLLPMRNHFNQYGGNEAGLNELMPDLKNAGVSGLLFKPFIGGDNLSSHKYWTIDPYVLNNSFTNKAAFKGFLNQMLKNGMKLYADGAFVNQGLNGVQFMSNLAHGFRSPFWDWFTYQENASQGGPLVFPKHTYEKFTFGVLPTELDKATGQREVAYNRFDIRLLNDPDSTGYNPRKPTFVELYDPRKSTGQGDILNSEDSVQNYRFPVSAEEVKEKRKEQLNQNLCPDERKKLLSEWKSFRLTGATLDDSAFKWDGQIDVAKMNMKNPAVVDYLDGAVGYWTRYVANTYVDTVTRALGKAQTKSRSNNPLTLLNHITQKPDKAPLGNQVLPPVTLPDIENVSLTEAKTWMESLRPVTAEKTGSTLAANILSQYSLSALPLPIMLKGSLSYPGLKEGLQNGTFNHLGKLLNALLAPLAALPGIGFIFGTVREKLLPPAFEKALARKMDQIIKTMAPADREKLRYGNIQSLVSDQLAENLLMQIFTGQASGNLSEQAIEDAVYGKDGKPGTVPLAILKADPEQASKLLPRWMKQRLDQIDAGTLEQQLEQQLDGLDPKLAALAEGVLKKREFGLNWRIDAAKDVGDMDKIRSADKEDRAALFKEEIQFVRKFWNQLGDTIHRVFPKSAIIAELTDFELLSNDDVAKEEMQKLFGDNVFTSTPNMRYLYSQLHQLVNFAQRPDEFGASQMNPSDFINSTIVPMSQAVPFPALRQYQNLTSSHDYSTSSHALLINPALFNMDHLRWWGLKDDLQEACAELQSKPCFEAARQQLSDIPNLPAVLAKLQDLAASDEIKNQLDQPLQNFLEEKSKKGVKDPVTRKRDSSNNTETPAELKPAFVKALFDKTNPTQLGLTADQVERLQAALTARISEPSEAKGMRGVIVNAALNTDWSKQAGQYGLTKTQAVAVKTGFEQALWQSLDQTISQFGRHFGYQPLDIALGHVFENLDPSWQSDLPANVDAKAFKQDLLNNLYADANRPVLEKLLRIFAVQNALPGNPSVYLPDLFAQGGSEFMKNIFVQNRNLIRIDKLQNDADFQTFYKEASNIFNTRQQLSALNDGVVLPVPASDEAGVLPIVRDNGKQQVIILIHTGKPIAPTWDEGKTGWTKEYNQMKTTQTRAENYKQDLSGLHLAPGTSYQDIATGERFLINDQGLLVSANNPQKGIDITVSRTLVREEAGKTSATVSKFQ